MCPLIIVQARLSSSRLPNKVLMPLWGKPMLEHTLERLLSLKTPTQLVVATSTDPSDDVLELFCSQMGVKIFRGSLEHVLDRFYQCAKNYRAEVVLRVTGDCPLVDPTLADQMLSFYLKNSNRYDYISNVIERSYPKGLDLEIMSFKALEKAHQLAKKPYQIEHVTPYLYEDLSRFKTYNFKDQQDFSTCNVSVDTLEDFKRVQDILEKNYAKNPLFGLKEIQNYFQDHPLSIG